MLGSIGESQGMSGDIEGYQGMSGNVRKQQGGKYQIAIYLLKVLFGSF